MFGLFGMPKLGKNHLLIDFVNLVYIVKVCHPMIIFELYLLILK